MLRNASKHLKKIIKHKKWVAHYCFMCGLYKQGILHDLSKFSPTEFTESVKYYQGVRSPIDACKEANSYSMAWFHHRGRNKHHWEYWMDDFEKGCIPKKIPFKYVLEMICDFLGAGHAYSEDKFSIESEYQWWQNKRKTIKLHDQTFTLMDIMFYYMNKYGIDKILKNRSYLKVLREKYESNSFQNVGIVQCESCKRNLIYKRYEVDEKSHMCDGTHLRTSYTIICPDCNHTCVVKLEYEPIDKRMKISSIMYLMEHLFRNTQ